MHPAIWVFVGFVATVVVAALFFLGFRLANVMAPSEQAQATSETVAVTTESSEAAASDEAQPAADPAASMEESSDLQSEDSLEIAASDILRVTAPTVAIDVPVSGEVRPASSCPQGGLCLEPPVSGQAAWDGELPAYSETQPIDSTDNYALFGHGDSTFENLSDIEVGDYFYVTTETGEFAYFIGNVLVMSPRDVASDFDLLGWESDATLLTYSEDGSEVYYVMGYLHEAAPAQ